MVETVVRRNALVMRTTGISRAVTEPLQIVAVDVGHLRNPALRVVSLAFWHRFIHVSVGKVRGNRDRGLLRGYRRRPFLQEAGFAPE